MLVFHQKEPEHFLRIAIVMRVLHSRDSEIRVAIVRITKTNTILKRPVNKFSQLKINIMTLTKQIREIVKRKPPPFPAVM